MSRRSRSVFADTSFWIAVIVKQDQFHSRAQQWSLKLERRIVTTAAVLLETANSLAKPAWRASCIALIEHIRQRDDVAIVELSKELLSRGWNLYSSRADKSWSLTDCISFRVMQESHLHDALTSDDHFRQAGFRALLLEDP